jgi:hypothetical protein
MKRIAGALAFVALLFLVLVLCSKVVRADEPETTAVTNVWLVSDSTNAHAWTRQAVMAKEDNTIIDPSGAFVATAEAAAQASAAEKVTELSQAAIEGMRSAIGGLEAVTNQVPPTAYHVSIALPPPDSPQSLMGFVVKEETDGATDTQWVWYSHRLDRKPIRRVVYRTAGGDISQNAEWVNWDVDGEMVSAYGRTWQRCHKCTIIRPKAAQGISAVTRQNEVFGGASGFDFGSVIVTVGGRPGITTNLTDAATGATLHIVNGFIKTPTKEAAE